MRCSICHDPIEKNNKSPTGYCHADSVVQHIDITDRSCYGKPIPELKLEYDDWIAVQIKWHQDQIVDLYKRRQDYHEGV